MTKFRNPIFYFQFSIFNFQFSIFNFQFLPLLFLLLACTSPSTEKKKSVTASVQSAPYELLVVANKEWLQTTAGKSLMDIVESEVVGLPQYEPSFRCTKINPAAFDGTFKMYGSVVVADIGNKYPQAELRVSKDVYCHPQLIIFLTAPNDKAFTELATNRKEQILDMLNEHEFARGRQALAKRHSTIVDKQAQKQFGVSIHVPDDIDEIKVGQNFFWASAGQQDFKLNVCMYTLPLTDLTLNGFIQARDSVMKINIPGGHEGQWMETDSRTVSCTVQTQNILIIRGLWDIRNDAMGGPFVSYVQKDEAHQRLLITEGFVFAPQTKKRALIRELEAALQTLTFTTNTQI